MSQNDNIEIWKRVGIARWIFNSCKLCAIRAWISFRSGSCVDVPIGVDYRLKNVRGKTRGDIHIHASFERRPTNTGSGRIECRNVDREDRLAVSAWRRALEIMPDTISPYDRGVFPNTRMDGGYLIPSVQAFSLCSDRRQNTAGVEKARLACWVHIALN